MFTKVLAVRSSTTGGYGQAEVTPSLAEGHLWRGPTADVTGDTPSLAADGKHCCSWREVQALKALAESFSGDCESPDCKKSVGSGELVGLQSILCLLMLSSCGKKVWFGSAIQLFNNISGQVTWKCRQFIIAAAITVLYFLTKGCPKLRISIDWYRGWAAPLSLVLLSSTLWLLQNLESYIQSKLFNQRIKMRVQNTQSGHLY